MQPSTQAYCEDYVSSRIRNHLTECLVQNRWMIKPAILLCHVFFFGLELDLSSISSTSVFKYELEAKDLE